jgi:hypothetical protein
MARVPACDACEHDVGDRFTAFAADARHEFVLTACAPHDVCLRIEIVPPIRRRGDANCLANLDRARFAPAMSDNPVPSSTLDPNPTPLATPQPKLTPAPIAIAVLAPSAVAASAPQSTMPSPTAPIEAQQNDTPKETPGGKTGVPNPWANHKPNDPLPTGVMPRPKIGVRAQPATTTLSAMSSAMNATSEPPVATAAPVIASAVPKLEPEHTGPITKKQRAFFASSPKVEISGLKNAPPLVPLPKPPTNVRKSEQVEMSGGVLVIERTSSAWIATAAVALAGIAIALVLGLDASAANDTVRQRENEIVELTKKVEELAMLQRKPIAPVVAPSAPADDVDTSAVVDAVRAKLAGEVTRNEARISIQVPRVTIALEGALDKKGRLSKKSADVLARAGAALAPLTGERIERVDVVAYSDGNVGRGKTEWGQSAARATNAARALGLDAKHVAVVGKGKGPGRRIELVITAK